MFPAGFNVDQVNHDGAPLAVKTASFSVAGQATATIVAGVPSKKIRVICLVAGAATAVGECRLQSNDTAIGAQVNVPKVNTIILPLGHNWFQTASGEALKVSNGAASGTVYGSVGYVEIPE